MINLKQIFKVGIILFIITAVCALLLAYANKITAPLIEKNNIAKTEESMKSVFPDADEFEKSESEAEGVDEIYFAKISGEQVGACVVSEANGYGGAVKVVTGIDKKLLVTGVEILSHSETPGLGANAEKSEFREQFVGKTANIVASKGDAKDNEINAMSGATITSKAVTKAVNIAIDAAKELMGGAE